MFTANPAPDFANLVDSLKFRDLFEGAYPLIAQHLTLVKECFERFISHEPTLTSDIRAALQRMPEANVYRLLASPYFAELLMLAENLTGEESDDRLIIRQQIIKSIIAEIKVSDPNYKHKMMPTWTIGGDVVLDPKVALQFPALRTDCGIGINYQSDIHNTGRPGIGGYSFEFGLKHKERIECAKQIISNTSKSALSLIETFTVHIQFRQNQLHPNVVNSSTHTSIGLIRCDNFHKIHNDMPEIVDMLVHESIHQYLHLFEEQLFKFVNVELPIALNESREFPSPWSGNLLDLRSYTHAILVWWGLVNFWSQYLHGTHRHPEVTTSHASSKLNEALVGFYNSGSVLDNLGIARQYLNPTFVSEVERLQKKLQMRKAI
jgi:hypothetical protein